MSYLDRFRATDDLIAHLTTIVPSIQDQALVANYTGFLSVSAVTVYELAIKDIFIDFSTKKHNTFGTFTGNHFSKINGRINLSNLRDEHVKAFGERYLVKFNSFLTSEENLNLSNGGESIKSSYGNLITCRHNYVHQGSPTLSFQEVRRFFENGKIVLSCLSRAMIR